jgi:PST family polysaccharide transporter
MATAAQVDTPIPVAVSASEKSYLQILKSTAIIGGSTVINVAFSIIRNKVLAVLLGPGGIGLFALYNSILDLAQAVAGVGVGSSGVRQIARFAGTGDDQGIAQTAIVLRRISIALGLLGGLLLALLALPASIMTFGDGSHTVAIAVLGLAAFCRLVSSGQVALIQGLRRIADLARINVLGSFFATVTSIPIVYVWGLDGIVPAIVVIAAASIATSWWYSRKIEISAVRISAATMRRESASLLSLGLVFMASAVLTIGSAYAIRLIVLRSGGLEAAGYYQAAWALGGLYAGFIMNAMGTDFYPRLTAVHHDHEACNRLVNEQAQIVMLLAGPGLLATLTFSPLVIAIFYTSEFHAAVDLLRWLCLGMMLRMIAWPMGFIILAKGARQAYFWTEVAATIVHVGLAWLLVSRLGLAGAGIAFFGLYVWHGLLIYVLVRRMSGFRWSRQNLQLMAIFMPASAAVFGAFSVLSSQLAMAFGFVVTSAAGIYALWMLLELLPVEALPQRVRPVIAAWRRTPS